MATLRMGNRTVTLDKSPNLFALRAASPAAGISAAAESEGGRVLPQNLGGFQLVEVPRDLNTLESSLDKLRADSRVDVGTHVYHTSEDAVPFVPTGELFVTFKPGATADERNAVLDDFKLQVMQSRGPDVVIARVTAGSPNPVKVAEQLQGHAAVEIAEPDLATPGRLAAFALPVGEPLMKRQWHLRNIGEIDGSAIGLKKGADARVVDAWARAESLGAPEVIVAVIDDGFDLAHPDLAGAAKVVAPWDFTRNSNDPQPEFSAIYPEWNQGEWQGDWHGTACAGVAVASANATGVVGSAPACRLLPVRWGVDLSDRQLELWFEYVAAHGAAVVSCSWSAAAKVFALSTRASLAISKCATEGRGGRGCVICFAAGNESRDIDSADNSSLNGFATHPHVIAVAASTSRDQQSDYSNFGDRVAVCAPSSGAGGRGITTADVSGTFERGGKLYEAGYVTGAYTDGFGGTSSATPLVAGICALLLSVRPELTATKVREIITSTARRIGPDSAYDASGHSSKYGHGCINADEAIKKVLS